MTEHEWLTCTDVRLMLKALGCQVNDRKWGLLTCANCRRVCRPAADSRCEQVVDAAERHTDCPLPEAERSEAWAKADRTYRLLKAALEVRPSVSGEVVLAVACARDLLVRTSTTPRPLRGIGMFWEFIPPDPDACDDIRDLFGNPFSPVAFDPSWLTSTVLALAPQMYESRDFSAMPILADAFQDAGCENPDILDHCRGPEPHVRGCWVLDQLLGKT